MGLKLNFELKLRSFNKLQIINLLQKYILESLDSINALILS